MARYNGPYSGEGGMGKLTTKEDFSKTAQSHDISRDELKRACLPWEEDTWKPGPVSKGGPPQYAPKGDATTKQVTAYSPSGKYAKKGGSGQRSGD